MERKMKKRDNKEREEEGREQQEVENSCQLRV